MPYHLVRITRHKYRSNQTLVASGPRYMVTGKVNQNVEPRPSSDVTPIPPPSSLASSRDIERPRPVPPNLRVVELSACWKGTNSDAQWLFESPIPVSLEGTSQSTATAINMMTHCTMNLMETISGSGVGLFGSTDTVHFTEPSSVNLTAF